jgi:uncharacterized protein YndB with AHSA1/START domain
MVRKILIAIAALVLVFAVVVALQPPTFHIERSIQIAAPPQAVFAQVNDFHKWRAWSPWEGKDPNLKRGYWEAPLGLGAVYTWKGNREVGEGRMTIEKSVRPREISIRLEFIAPFTATNMATFTFVPEGSGTKVTWAMDGKNTTLTKIAHLVMNMDKMLGADFERGLRAMKQAAEQGQGNPESAGRAQ